ncbi:MAG TPA: DUF6329 domain-containing protein [Bacillota bacterium]|nr:DUF6329 domain-containing protein [Bacillota bacterium]
MKNKRLEIIKELNETQGFINTVETAKDYSLGLDEETYNKYNTAIERQKELAAELDKLESSYGGIRTSGIFYRKEPALEPKPIKIDAVVSLQEEQYHKFTQNLLTDYDFIHDNIDNMYVDRQDASHCLIVLGDGENDGILVDSQGSNYARYVSFLPNARDFIQKNIQTMADEIIREGTAQTKNGSFVLGFDELSERFDTPILRDNYFGEAILAELKTRDSLTNVIANDNGIALTFTEQTEVDRPALTIWQLMAANLEDVHLLDVDEDHDLATIEELNRDTLTVQGIADWSDVLDASVERINFGDYGLQLHVSGSTPQRLKDFSYMLASHCPISDYERWVNPSVDENFDMKWSDNHE